MLKQRIGEFSIGYYTVNAGEGADVIGIGLLKLTVVSQQNNFFSALDNGFLNTDLKQRSIGNTGIQRQCIT
ncbi:hypothetical protein D3C79_1098210 [compost metagenome]